MKKYGYIMAMPECSYSSIQQWMEEYGCDCITIEQNEHEKLRPQWKALVKSLNNGDEVVLCKFSNALRGTRELSFFLEYCRRNDVRVISVMDKIDTAGVIFKETTPKDILTMVALLPSEVASLRRSVECVIRKKSYIRPKSLFAYDRQVRETLLVNMYNEGHSFEDIQAKTGYHSRSSIFRILNKFGIKLNRGSHSGPIKKWSERKLAGFA